MSPLLVVANPRPKKKGRKKLTGAAKAAFLARMAGGRKGRKSKSKKKHHVAVARENPRPKRKSGFFSIGKVGGSKKRVRRNPIDRGAEGQLISQVETAAWGAAGAIGTGMIFSALAPKLPVSFQTGVQRQIAKAALVIGLGMLGERFLPKDKAQAAVIGALTIVGYTAALPYVAKAAPNSNLGRQLNRQLGAQLSGAPRRPNALANPNALMPPRGALAGLPGRMPSGPNALGGPVVAPQQYQRPLNPTAHAATGPGGWRGARR